jgi:hypothetical protein
MNELPNKIAPRLKMAAGANWFRRTLAGWWARSRRTASPKVEPFDTASPREENGG